MPDSGTKSETPYPSPYGRPAHLFHRAAALGSKLVSSLRGQREASHRWLAWARDRDRHATTLWVHAPSVGEALVVEPVLRRLRAALGERLTIVHTHTSPSVPAWPHSWIADRTDYLPLPGMVREVCRTIRPTVMLYPRGELWPHLVAAGNAVNAYQVIIAGQIRNGSGRVRFPTRRVIGRLARQMSLATVCSTHDVERWCRLGVHPAKILVTGDTRDDYVVERPMDIAHIDALRVWRRGRRVMIAGSTHPTDEQYLIDALASQSPLDTLVLAPHETNQHHVRLLVRAANARRFETAVWPGYGPVPDCRLLIVACQGMLQDLYAVADIAYVGGGFDSSGVHSVAEAAVFAAPILVGPRGGETPECERFLAAAGATRVNDARQLASVWREWSHRPALRAQVGLAARRVLATGASSKTTPYLLEMLAR